MLLDPWKRGMATIRRRCTVGKPDVWSTGESGNEQIGNWLTSPPNNLPRHGFGRRLPAGNMVMILEST